MFVYGRITRSLGVGMPLGLYAVVWLFVILPVLLLVYTTLVYYWIGKGLFLGGRWLWRLWKRSP